MLHYIFMISVFILASIGQILLKIGQNSQSGFKLFVNINIPTLTGLFLYAITSILWLKILQYTAISKAYPFLALTFVVVPFLGFFILHEDYTIKTFLGTLLIIFGLIVISR